MGAFPARDLSWMAIVNVPAPGRFLVASPILQDPNFRRTVVLLCEHDDEQGSMGIIVNRPSELKLDDTLLNAEGIAPQPLWIGGPVQRDAIVVLHRSQGVPGSKELVDGMAIGGEEAAIVDLLRGPHHQDVRVFSGYAGWGAGQLADELQERSWLVVPARAHLVFDVPADALWATVLRSLGPGFAYLAQLPLDPRVN